MIYLLLVMYAALSVAGLTLFKLGTQSGLSVQITNLVLSVKISWLSLLGLAMYVVSFLVYMGLIAKSELSYITPLATASIYILTMLVSLFIFHEEFGLLKCVGIVMILSGVVLMNLKK